jgi:hypothetical protein
VAEKARTAATPYKVRPPGPRPPRRKGSAGARRTWYVRALTAAGVLTLAIVLAVVVPKLGAPGRSSTSAGRTSARVDNPDLATLPGAVAGTPPWPPEEARLVQRARILGIPANPTEMLRVHYHAHLDLYDDGRHLSVPALIGISLAQDTITALHTHDASGIIHVESPTKREYTLGQFFGVWGLRLSKGCLGGLCVPPGQALRVWVDGHPFHGDPTRLVLENHEEIVVAYGTPPARIPSRYDFSAVG